MDLHKADYERLEKTIARERAVDRVMQAAVSGAAIELSPNDIATAKLYARAKALNELNNVNRYAD